jgi:hypothetical protein
MKTLKAMSTIELLSSFNVGQGKTVDLPNFASIENGVIKYNNLEANVSPEWQQAYLLMQLHKEVKDASTERQEKLFSAYNEGRLALTHNLVEGTVTSKKPLPGHVLTSSEYLQNCFAIAANVENIISIYNDANAVLQSVNPTKADLTAVLTAIVNTIVTDTQKATMQVLADKEIAFEKVKTELSEFAELVFLSETKIKAIVKPANLDTVINKFTSLNYVQQSVDFDSKTMSMVCVFDNEKV